MYRLKLSQDKCNMLKTKNDIYRDIPKQQRLKAIRKIRHPMIITNDFQP